MSVQHKQHFRKALPTAEPKVEFSTKTGDYKISPLSPDEEEATRTIYLLTTKKIKKAEPKIDCGFTKKRQLEEIAKKRVPASKPLVPATPELPAMSSPLKAPVSNANNVSWDFDASPSSPEKRRGSQQRALDTANTSCATSEDGGNGSNLLHLTKKKHKLVMPTPSPQLTDQEREYEASRWSQKRIDVKAPKPIFHSHRCTFGLPREKLAKLAGEASFNPPPRAKTTTPSRFFSGRVENCMMPDPLSCSTPDPTLGLMSGTDFGLPSIRRKHLEKNLRPGVELSDVSAADFLNPKSPFLPNLKKEEEEVDESFMRFHRQRRRGSDDSESGLGGGIGMNAFRDFLRAEGAAAAAKEQEQGRSAKLKEKEGLNVILQRPREHANKVSQESAAIVEKALSRAKEDKAAALAAAQEQRRFAVPNQRQHEMADGEEPLPGLTRRTTMSFAESAAYNTPLLHNAEVNVQYGKKIDPERKRQILQERRQRAQEERRLALARPKSPFRYTSSSASALAPILLDAGSDDSDDEAATTLDQSTQRKSVFCGGGMVDWSNRSGMSESPSKHRHGKACKKKCIQCNLVEGIIDDFEQGFTDLRDRRRQDEMLSRHRTATEVKKEDKHVNSV